MKIKTNFPAGRTLNTICLIGLALLSPFFQACDSEDPDPVNDEEVITTVRLTLAPDGDGDPVVLSFYDADGELGSTAPVISVSGPLMPMTSYAAVVELLNETVSPSVNVMEEVVEEAADHLFCYNASGDISISYEDEDENGLPLGLITLWETGAAGEGSVTVVLRHQPGTKTGECPGTGETDVEVTFDLLIQ